MNMIIDFSDGVYLCLYDVMQTCLPLLPHFLYDLTPPPHPHTHIFQHKVWDFQNKCKMSMTRHRSESKTQFELFCYNEAAYTHTHTVYTGIKTHRSLHQLVLCILDNKIIKKDSIIWRKHISASTVRSPLQYVFSCGSTSSVISFIKLFALNWQWKSLDSPCFYFYSFFFCMHEISIHRLAFLT